MNRKHSGYRMKYTGRISCLIISFFTFIGFILEHQLSEGYIHISYVYVGFFFAPLCWLMGIQYDKAKYLSEMDSLTSLYNRRYAADFADKLIARSVLQQTPMLLLLIDANKFKEINDTHGHAAGDRVLQGIAEVLIGSVNRSDAAVRWGGDEFLVISQGGDISSAQDLTRRIHSGIRGLSERLGLEITVSIGMAASPGDGSTLDALMKKADERMYEDKQAGSSN